MYCLCAGECGANYARENKRNNPGAQRIFGKLSVQWCGVGEYRIIIGDMTMFFPTVQYGSLTQESSFGLLSVAYPADVPVLSVGEEGRK